MSKSTDNDNDCDSRVLINRSVLNKKKFDENYTQTSEYPTFKLKHFLINDLKNGLKCDKRKIKKQVYNRIPAIKWLRHYNFREFLMKDCLAGLTVGTMHIPYGLALSALIGLPPVNGLYVSLFAPLIYLLFGTSRQLSLGTDSIIALLTTASIANIEAKYVPPLGFDASNSTDIDTSNFLSLDRTQALVNLAQTFAFFVAIIQLLMFTFQLGFLSVYLSDPLIEAFTSGASIHIITAQLGNLFGVTLVERPSYFSVPKGWIGLFSNIQNTNVAAIVISIITMIFLYLIKYQINERFNNRLPFPLPAELIIVIIATSVSYSFHFDEEYNLKVVGLLPTGVPLPTMPSLWIYTDVLLSSFIIAAISFAINFSLADGFSKRHKYKIYPSQELLAYGVSNLVCSFFSCFPSGASLPRSTLQDNAGAKTQLTSLISSCIVILVIFKIGVLFEFLPKACLGAIICIALKNRVLLVLKLPYYWKVNKIEFLIWIVTYLSVLIIDVDFGLGIGLIFYVFTFMFLSSKPHSTILGNIKETEIYKDTKFFSQAQQIDKIKIIRIEDSLHATNAPFFRKAIYKLTNVKPQEHVELIRRIKKAHIRKEMEGKTNENITFKNIINKFFRTKTTKNELKSQEEGNCQNITNTLDKSSVFKIDELEISKETIVDKLHSNNLNEFSVEVTNKDENKNLEDVIEESDDESTDLPNLPVNYIIIDCTPITYIDTVGVHTLHQLIEDYKEIGIKFLLAGCTDYLLHFFKKVEKAEKSVSIPDELIYISIHDAVVYAQKKYLTKL